jgi:hypothetical protein
LALSTAYRAQTNGASEIVNKFLGNYLRMFTNARKKNWPSLLSAAQRAINTSYNSAIGMSPCEARFGFNPATPVLTEGKHKSKEAAIAALQESQRLAERCCHDTLWKHKDSMISKHAEAFPSRLEEGDLVHVSTTALLPKNVARINHKLTQRFVGPYEIVRKISPEAYEVKLPDCSRAHPVISLKFLKKFTQSDEFPLRPSPDEDPLEDLVDYKVEAILKHKVTRGTFSFLVKWLQYGPESNSYEPVESFMNEEGEIHNETLYWYLQKHRIKGFKIAPELLLSSPPAASGGGR